MVKKENKGGKETKGLAVNRHVALPMQIPVGAGGRCLLLSWPPWPGSGPVSRLPSAVTVTITRGWMLLLPDRSV